MSSILDTCASPPRTPNGRFCKRRKRDPAALAEALLHADLRVFPPGAFEVRVTLTQLTLTAEMPPRLSALTMGRVLADAAGAAPLPAPAYSDESLPMLSTDATSPLEYPPSEAPWGSESSETYTTPAEISSPSHGVYH